jgi:plasmid stabilization system protein ParE
VTRIRWTTVAADQLKSFVNPIREDHPDAARALAETILNRIAQLETSPRIGRPERGKGTRELVSAPYVIVYRLKDDVAEILHIWHGAQDWR